MRNTVDNVDQRYLQHLDEMSRQLGVTSYTPANLPNDTYSVQQRNTPDNVDQRYIRNMEEINRQLGVTSSKPATGAGRVYFSGNAPATPQYRKHLLNQEFKRKYTGKNVSQLVDIFNSGDGIEYQEEYDWLEDYLRNSVSNGDYRKALDEKLIEFNEADEKLKWMQAHQDQVMASTDPELFKVPETYERLKNQVNQLRSQEYFSRKRDEYANIQNNPDFGEKSKEIDYTLTGTFGDFKYAAVNEDSINGANSSVQGNYFSELSNEKAKYNFMSDDERDKYNYLYATKGKKSANDYLEYIGYDLNKRRMKALAEETAKWANEHPAVSSAASVPMHLRGGLGLIDVAAQNIRNAVTGEWKPIDYNSSMMNDTVGVSAIRGTVADKIADKTGRIKLDEEKHPALSPILNGKSLGDVYQLGMSMVDSAANAVLGRYLGFDVGSILLGGSAGSQGMLDALAKGASDTQALSMGLLNGTFEALFEHVSLDKLLTMDTKNIAKAIALQGFVEGSEEFNTSLANTAADLIVMAGKSDYKTSIRKYMAEGMSEKDATKKALLDIAIGLGWDFVGGFVTGGIMGGVHTAADNFLGNNYTGKKSPREKNANNAETESEYQSEYTTADVNGGELTVYGNAPTAEEHVHNVVRNLDEEIARAEAAKADLETEIENEQGPMTKIKLQGELRQVNERLDELKAERAKYGETESSSTTTDFEESNVTVEQAETGDTEPITGNEKTENTNKVEAGPVQAAQKARVSAADNGETENNEQQAKGGDLNQRGEKYGKQAGAFVHTYEQGQDVEKYDYAYSVAYGYGKTGVDFDTIKDTQAVSYLSEKQRELAYKAGQAANKGSTSTGSGGGNASPKTGTVKGDGVTVKDLKEQFNDPQGMAYTVLSTIAQATGINIVLYKSSPDANGKFTQAQGRFDKNTNTIYLDLNAGLSNIADVDDMTKYTVLRSFCHEFTHFIENNSPELYNELCDLVCERLEEQGMDVEARIERIIAISRGKLTKDGARRELVAEAMTDILPDSHFVEELAQEHRSLFERIRDKLKEFLAKIKAAFNAMTQRTLSKEAKALKTELNGALHYFEDIVAAFDKAAKSAVNNYMYGSESNTAVAQDTVENNNLNNGGKENGGSVHEGRAGENSKRLESRLGVDDGRPEASGGEDVRNDQGGLPTPQSDGTGADGVSVQVPKEAGQGNDSRRGLVADDNNQGGISSRDGDIPNAAGTVRERGQGDSERGDILLSDRLDTAISMMNDGASSSEIYDATGLVATNGQIRDGFDGDIIWRREDVGKGRTNSKAEEDVPSGVEAGIPEAGPRNGGGSVSVSGRDGKQGGRADTPEGAGNGTRRNPWETLTNGKRKKAQRVIIEQIVNSGNDESLSLIEAFDNDDKELAKFIYSQYAAGDVPLEQFAGYFEDVETLIGELDDISKDLSVPVSDDFKGFVQKRAERKDFSDLSARESYKVHEIIKNGLSADDVNRINKDYASITVFTYNFYGLYQEGFNHFTALSDYTKNGADIVKKLDDFFGIKYSGKETAESEGIYEEREKIKEALAQAQDDAKEEPLPAQSEENTASDVEETLPPAEPVSLPNANAGKARSTEECIALAKEKGLNKDNVALNKGINEIIGKKYSNNANISYVSGIKFITNGYYVIFVDDETFGVLAMSEADGGYGIEAMELNRGFKRDFIDPAQRAKPVDKLPTEGVIPKGYGDKKDTPVVVIETENGCRLYNKAMLNAIASAGTEIRCYPDKNPLKAIAYVFDKDGNLKGLLLARKPPAGLSPTDKPTNLKIFKHLAGDVAPKSETEDGDAFDKGRIDDIYKMGLSFMAALPGDKAIFFSENGDSNYLCIDDAGIIVSKSAAVAKGYNSLEDFEKQEKMLVSDLTSVMNGATGAVPVTETPLELPGSDKVYGKAVMLVKAGEKRRAFTKQSLKCLKGGLIFYNEVGQFGTNDPLYVLYALDGNGELMGFAIGGRKSAFMNADSAKPTSSAMFNKKNLEKAQALYDRLHNVEKAASEEPIPPQQDEASEETITPANQTEKEPESGDTATGEEQANPEVVEAIDEAAGVEAIEQEIERQKDTVAGAENFVIENSLYLPSGEKARIKANIQAIRLVKTLNDEGRPATREEQLILSKYVGWGGLSNAFGNYYGRNAKDNRNGYVPKKGYEDEFNALYDLVDEGIITQEEYNSMANSTLNAHYTSIEIIKAMYTGMSYLGFKGGRLLEPACGVGNFVGSMPPELAVRPTSWSMVELDALTGQIAKYLYPRNDVRIEGFETSTFPDGYFDAAISNVPFGNFGVTDSKYNKVLTKSIHNYFFVKALDKVRPGGIVMFITSSFTMDAENSAVREYIATKADLLGAIRLPNSAFQSNANTKVVTDIIVLKRRGPGARSNGIDFKDVGNVKGKDEKGREYSGKVNKYYINNPQMVLGTYARQSMYSSKDGLTVNPIEGSTLQEQIEAAFRKIIFNGQMEYPIVSPETANFAVERENKKPKTGGYEVKDGAVYKRNENGTEEKFSDDKKTVERVAGLLAIKEAYFKLIAYQQQGQDKKYIAKARAELNKAYDDFKAKFGCLNMSTNKKLLADEPNSYSLLALENDFDSKKKTATKADIFTVDTISPIKTINHVENVEEGIVVSVNTVGGIDPELIGKLTGRSAEDVTAEMLSKKLAYKEWGGKLITPAVYLSGNVRQKLEQARAWAEEDKSFAVNVKDLEKVVPKDIKYFDIYAPVGAPWIPVKVYEQFCASILGCYDTDVEIVRVEENGKYSIKFTPDGYRKDIYKTNNTQKWGTKRRKFIDIMDAMLNSRDIIVKSKDEMGKEFVDRVETAAAQEKADKIQEAFQKWLWKDKSRRDALERLYNQTFNCYATAKYDGTGLTVNGINPKFQLRTHQADAVKRIITSGGNTLLAHRVGAGKTLEMAAAAMKLRELGIIKKPLIIAPKALVAQWGKEFHEYFPAAKLLVADDGSFTAANRKVFINKIINGDYDSIIISYEQFGLLPLSEERQLKALEREKEDALDAKMEAMLEKGDTSLTVKALSLYIKKIEERIKKLTSGPKDTDNVEFEALGIDGLFVDEAHNFKNLVYSSAMTNVVGLGNRDGSKKAYDLYSKVQYLQELNGGKGIVFATATPVMNSMVEMYTMQRYLQPDVLRQLKLTSFDAWAKMFGEVVNAVEINPSGTGFRLKRSFSRFKNLNELQMLFRQFSDVVRELPYLKIPKMKGGKIKIVESEAGEFQKSYMEKLAGRSEAISKGGVDPKIDNMLKVTGDGRKISYTQRLIDPSLPYEAGCKVVKCVENVAAEYFASGDILGTQLIFCDASVPKGAGGEKKKGKKSGEELDIDADDQGEVEEDDVRLYDDIRDMLIEKGIPKGEIAYIHEANTAVKKDKLSKDMNAGRVRVLIGSTGKMGVGLNVQKKAVAIHHLDAPWRPGDIEQRDGRVFRQGNENDEVSKYVYITVGTFDSRLWDILDRKQAFIDQIMNGENIGREVEDTGEVTLSAAEVKAIASGSPLIKEQVELQAKILKLQNLYSAHMTEKEEAKYQLARDERRISATEKNIANLKADMADIDKRGDTYSEEKFALMVGRQVYNDPKEAGQALVAAINEKVKEEGKYIKIGSFAGLDILVGKFGSEYKGELKGHGAYPFNVYMAGGFAARFANHIAGIVRNRETRLTQLGKDLENFKKDKAEQEIIAKSTFGKEDELSAARTRFNEIMKILNPEKGEQNMSEMVDDAVQEQARDYLNRDAVDYAEGIDYWAKNGRADGNIFTLGSTGSVLQGLGAIESDVYVQSSKINTILNEHPEMTLKEIKSLPEILENPVLVLGSRNADHARVNTRLVLIGMVKAQNKLPVMAILDLQPLENCIVLNDMQKIVSAYTKDSSPDAAMKLVQRSEVLYADKDVTAKLLHTLGFQYAQRIEHGGYVGSISYKDDEVNISGISFDKMLGDEGQYQYRDFLDDMDDTDILEMAAKGVTVSDLTSTEKAALEVFSDRLEALRQAVGERARLGRLYKEQQFGENVDREAAKATLGKMHELDKKVKECREKLYEIQNGKVLERVLKQSWKVVKERQKKHDDEKAKRAKDRRDNSAAIKKYRERIEKDVDDLAKWILNPSNKNAFQHVPEPLRNAVIEFISSIDFSSKRSLNGGEATIRDKNFAKRLNNLKNAVKQCEDINGLYSGYNDLPPNFLETFQRLIDQVQSIIDNNYSPTDNGDYEEREFIINRMTAEELNALSKVIRIIKKLIVQMNQFHQNAMFQHVYEAGDESINYMEELGDDSYSNGLTTFMFWDNMRPAYAFERFGPGGKSIFDELRNGQSKLAFNVQAIKEFTESAYTEDEVKEWEKTVLTFNIDGESVKIPVSFVMSLYCLSKRPQAQNHLNGGGIRVATFKDGTKKVSDKGHEITQEQISTMINALTPRQKEVADALQQFMANQGRDWGNFVSIARFGVKQFIDPNYFPINSDGRWLAANADESPSAASLYALLNMSFTKPLTEEANNRLILYSIFDVFSNHMASMAQYNALALPVLDSIKWFNYRQTEFDEDGNKVPGTSLREEMARVYGAPEETRPGSGKKSYAEAFVMNIIKAFNGTENHGATDEPGVNAIHRYNVAQVAFNFRVVLQQPLAITRAGMIIDYTSIIKELNSGIKRLKANIEQMLQYSGIALWKSLGFYDINISRGLTDIIKHKNDVLDKINEVGMWGAEQADLITWGAMWGACKNQVTKDTGLREGDEGFFEAVTELFEEVIYKTQVVDSVLTKNEFLRKKNLFNRLLGSFMSEPTTTASMLLNAAEKFHADQKRGYSTKEAWQRNRGNIGRTAFVFAVGALLLAGVTGFADALRDDDDYATFFQKWQANFRDNLVDETSVINKLPLFRDMYEALKSFLGAIGFDTYGFESRSVIFQWLGYITKSAEIIHDKITGVNTNYTWYGAIYNMLRGVSGMTGLPISAAMREVQTAWNNTVGYFAPSLKLKTYEASEKTQIKSAYLEGNLSEDEAVSALLVNGVAGDEDDAYWIIQEWNSGDDGYSKFGGVMDAVRSGGDFQGAMKEMTEHGYTQSDVQSQIKKNAKQWLLDKEVSKEQALNILTKYVGIDAAEAKKNVNQWACELETGIPYADIGEKLINGEITQERARQMWQSYGSMSADDAYAKAEGIVIEQKYPGWNGAAKAVGDYQRYGKGTGISEDVFIKTMFTCDNFTGYDGNGDGETDNGSVRAQRWNYINSLPLSREQKNAFHLAYYKESTLSKAPWNAG